ncbi:unnamed protein product [Gongylonema pulchrum]|uniref:Secreted protein n=1 Tax=Gongylonema pulchrum TaxID=637853 RepID=A0A183D6P3_9BILA|nr:unnamed protein product [Gongylonema pulchrum]
MMLRITNVLSVSLITMTYGQMGGSPEPGDPTNQELALLDWTSGIRVNYCTDAPIDLLVEPFKKALTESLNKYCRNATACRLHKSALFTRDHIVLLDGYPRRDYGAVQFRFVVVLPPDAVPMDRHLRQPLLTRNILSGNFLLKVDFFKVFF